MKKFLFKFSILLILLNITSVNMATPHEYNNLYVLGDSLNDSTENGKSVSGGKTWPTQTEILYQKLFKQPLINYKNSGTNYSVFGNEVLELVKILDEENFDVQKIGHNNLLFLSVGNNDIGTEIFLHFFSRMTKKRQLDYNDMITTRLSDLAKNLGNNYNNTVIVNTIPDLALTPMLSNILVFPRIDVPQYFNFYYNIKTIYNTSRAIYRNIYDVFDLPFIKKTMKWVGIYTPQAIREYASKFEPDPNIALSNNIRNYTLGMYKNTLLGSILPISKIYDMITNLLKKYTLEFNQSYLQKILNIDENIVILDINQALIDVFQNHQEFGFDDYVSTACSSGTLSLINQICDEHTKFIDESRTHVFGDLIHPSAMAQQALADYAISILNAPIQYSSILIQQLYVLNSVEQSIGNEIHYLLNQPMELNSSKMILNYALIHNELNDYQGVRAEENNLNFFNIGYLYQNSLSNTLGLLLTLNYSKMKGYENYHYKIKEPIISFFNLHRFNDNLWSSFELGYAKITINDILRTIPMYKGKATEYSDKTKGHNAHFNIKLGYLYPITQQMSLNTYLGATHNNFKINAFNEKNKSSTSISFDKINFRQTYATLGLNLSYHIGDMQYFSSLALNHSFNQSNYAIKSGLKKFLKKFKRQIEVSNKNWLNFKLGIQKAITAKSSIQTSLEFNHGLSSKHQYKVNLGWNHQFK